MHAALNDGMLDAEQLSDPGFQTVSPSIFC
jgi:hypothetical protein